MGDYGPYTDSEAMKRTLHVPGGVLSSHLNQYNPHPPYATQYGAHTVKKPRASSAPARRVSSQVVPWRSAGYSPRRPRSGNVNLNLRSLPSDVSKRAPYAPRQLSVFEDGLTYVSEQPKVNNAYSSLNDPHLQEYFIKKFANPRIIKVSKKGLSPRGRRPGRHTRGTGPSEVVYKVAVTTGNKKNGGTDAKVFMTLKGTKGHLPKKHLTKKVVKRGKKVPFRFLKGTTNVFKIVGKEIGELKSLTIEHDGLTKGQGWFLEQIEVVNTATKKAWIFSSRQWLSLHEGDCQISRELYPKRYYKTEYEVVTVTGNQKGAGTDANVFMTLYGKSGSTQRIQLKNKSKDIFERNQSDIFHIKAPCVGPLTKLRIEHDNTGFAAGWFLDRIVVSDTKNPKWKYYFPCGQWLAKDEGDGQTSRYLIGSKDPLATRKLNQYKITVYTGDKRGAGTDANVYVTLFGDSGESGERKIDNSKNNFERGQQDEFMIDCPSLGRLRRLRIGHDNWGPSPGWFLDKVIVDDLEHGRVYEFPCQRWFAKDEDDGAISRELLCNAGPHDAAPGVPYTIHVTTGDVRQAATSARIYIILYGGKKGEQTSGKIWLEGGTFERGRTDIFNVEVNSMLSPLSRVDIGHDNSGAGPGWYLDKVMVNCPSAGVEQWFVCDKWLAQDEGDGLIERTLHEAKGMRKQRKKLVTWFVWVHTSDIRGAGTDANVKLVAYGKNKDGEYLKSDEVTLDNKGDNFEQGETDKFKIEMEEIGKPYKIRVGHDNSGGFPGWHLNKIEMENMSTNKRYIFKCGRWLAKDEEDKQIVRELPAEGDDIKRPEPLVKYQVEVHTGKKRGAGTDANVFVDIFGQQGDTGDRALEVSQTNKNKFENGNQALKFETGQVDEFLIEAVTLKKLKKIRIGHDGKNPGAGWFLDKVVVKPVDADDAEPTVFECGRWLAVDEDDGLIVREITAGGSQMLSTTSYHVSVKTGDVRGAGTDANVFIKIFGAKGDTGVLWLKSSENTKNKFERARTDLFKIEATDIGKIERIRVGHDSTKLGAGWFLDEVRIDVPSRGENYVFACHRWLDKDEEDGQTEVELEPTHLDKGQARIPYELTVWTGTDSGAGTDANVFIQMYGEHGKTEEYQLRNRTDNFETGQMDKFKIEAADIGPLNKIRIGHDGAGMFSGWFLEKLLIQRYPAKTSKRRKIARRQSFKQISRSQAADSEEEALNKRLRKKGRRDHYESEDSGAESDFASRRFQRRKSLTPNRRGRLSDNSETESKSGVRRKRTPSRKGRYSDEDSDLESRKGQKKRQTLSRKGRYDDGDDSDFESGKGMFGKRRGSRRGRYSDDDDLESTRGSSKKRQRTPGRGRYSDDSDVESKKAKGRKRTPSRKGKYSDDSDVESRKGVKRSKSPLLRKTGKSRDRSRDSEDSDLDSRRGAKRSKSPLQRKMGKGKDRYRDSEDSDGDVKKKGRKYERKSKEDKPEEDIEEYWFVCNRWFAKSEDDGKIIRELLPTDEQGNPLDTGLKEVEYTVKVCTGDVRGAGTDANVFINITGEFGDTGERQLSESDNINKFERNQEDVFRINAVELGRLKKVKIRHDNKGGFAAWFLGHVEIEDSKTKTNWFFPCQRWLAVNEDDGQIARELVPVDKSLKKKLSRKDSMAIRNEVALETKAAMQTYHVFVHTGNKLGAGTDANVYVILFGEVDDTGTVFLKSSKTNKNKFERNQMDEFVVEAVDIGELRKIKIGHDNAGGGGAWHLDRVEIDCPSLGKKWVFPCGRWLAKDEDDGLLERELYPQDMATEEYIPCVPYEVTTHTSDVSGAGTDADVYVVLYGKDTMTQQKSLCPAKKERKNLFERNQEDKFVVEMEDVGPTIEKIRIGHDGTGWGAGWHLNKVTVRRLKDSGRNELAGGSETYTFSCGRWLARNEDDGAIVRELVADQIISETTRKDGSLKKKEINRRDALKSKNYTVNVYTGDKRGAGTDANVFLTMYGDKGDSGERKLHKSETYRDKFEAGQVDKFKLEAVDLGKLYKVRIRHDNSMFSPAWFLDKIDVEDPVDKETFVFYCERWLGKNKDDGKIDRTLYIKGYDGEMSSTSTLRSTFKASGSMASLDSLRSSDPFSKSPRLNKRQMEDIPEGPTIPYTVKVVTGEDSDCGTESNVWIKIIGPKKLHTGKQFLELAQRRRFEPGSVETFSLEASDVKDVKQIELGHDGVTAGSGWFVKEVEIDMPTKGKHYFFTCKQWLARDKGDGKTSRVFSAQDGEASMISYKPLVPYELTVHTGDIQDAGTDSQIFIKVFGGRGSTSEINLDKGSDRFERARKDLIKLELDDIAPIKKLRIGHNGKGTRPEWFVDKVELRNMDNHDLTVFKCNSWFSKSKGDGKMVRDLVATVKGKEQLKVTTYKINVKTSDVRGAGTDANVYVCFFGEGGDSGDLHLKESQTNKSPFENNQVDTFTFSHMYSLGHLTKLRVWHDNKGFGAAWHLAHVEVEDVNARKKFMFPCNKWLSKSEDDKQICRELTCANLASPGAKDRVTYEIAVTTTDKTNAGIMHNAWLILDGEQKSSEKFLMENNARNKVLRRGQTDTFTLVSKNLGRLERCILGAVERDDKPLGDADGREASWHCHEVVVTNRGSGDRYTFPCKAWIPITRSMSKKYAKILEVKDIEESKLTAVKNLAPVKYEVIVVTGDLKSAGTDANVQITIYGEHGETGKRALTQRFRDLFERNQTDKFIIEALDLGELHKVKIEHDNSGWGAGWFLDHIEIVNTGTSKRWTFPCSQWLDKKKGDGEIVRELLARD